MYLIHGLKLEFLNTPAATSSRMARTLPLHRKLKLSDLLESVTPHPFEPLLATFSPLSQSSNHRLGLRIAQPPQPQVPAYSSVRSSALLAEDTAGYFVATNHIQPNSSHSAHIHQPLGKIRNPITINLNPRLLPLSGIQRSSSFSSIRLSVSGLTARPSILYTLVVDMLVYRRPFDREKNAVRRL